MRPGSGGLLSFLVILCAILVGPQLQADRQALLNPSQLNEQAPETYRVKFVTSEGEFVIEVNRPWSPAGGDRFLNLVKNGFYDGAHFYRVMPGYIVQFGLGSDPELVEVWRQATITDDPVAVSNTRGTVTFVGEGTDNRTTEVFINLKDTARLDEMGFSPFGSVIQGMDVVDRLYSGYGDAPPGGMGPERGKIQVEGTEYLSREFPELDYITSATIVSSNPGQE